MSCPMDGYITVLQLSCNDGDYLKKIVRCIDDHLHLFGAADFDFPGNTRQHNFSDILMQMNININHYKE
jgi:hypothetical protein